MSANSPVHRCPWAEETELYHRHHDEEWGVPQHDGRALWEHLVLDGFQAGLSWLIVLRKREDFRSAFEDFEPEKVARYGPRDVARLLADARIIRSKAKIAAAIANARAYIAMRDAGQDFADFAWEFVGGRPIQNAWKSQGSVPSQTPLSGEVSKTLKGRGFKFVGPVTVYAWMQAVGLVNDHLIGCFRYPEVAALGKQRHKSGAHAASGVHRAPPHARGYGR
jgi:DNA-3-methyladenine glycosylase I